MPIKDKDVARFRLKIIKQLLKSLEKQGLFKGRLHYKYQAYIFSKESGIQEVALEKSLSRREASEEGIDVEVDIKKSVPTINRELVSTKSGPSQFKKSKKKVRELPQKKTESRLLPKLLFPMVLVVVVLFAVIFFINRQMSQPEADPHAETPLTATDHPFDQTDEIAVNQREDREKDLFDQDTESGTKTHSGEDRGEIEALETEPENQKAKPENPAIDKAKSEEPMPYRHTISIRGIPDTLNREYSQQVKTLRVDLPRKTKVSGYLKLNLFIKESGKVYLSGNNDTGLRVDPDSRRKKVLKKLKEMISKLRLKAPIDKTGRTVKVENWSLNYQVTQFKRRMILRKQ